MRKKMSEGDLAVEVARLLGNPSYIAMHPREQRARNLPSTAKEMREFVARARELLAQHEINAADLNLLGIAIESGDPRSELLVRVRDLIAATDAALAKAGQ